MDSTWTSRLEKELGQVASRATRARTFYDTHRSPLERYRGGAPIGFLAAIAEFESGGRMLAGDVGLGEYGFFQITASTPETLGLAPSLRTTPEGNIFLAGAEYNIEAQRIVNRFPGVSLGSKDNWLLARLAFAIGAGGTRTLLTKAGAAGFGSSSYSAVLNYVNKVGGVPLGSQSAGKVWLRVNLVPVIWDVGQRAAPMSYGNPKLPPAPLPLLSYKVPSDVKDTFKKDRGNMALAAAAIGVAAFLYMR